MAVITLPTLFEFREINKLQLTRAGAGVRGRYTATRQYAKFPYAIWFLEGQLVPMEGADAGRLRSFLVQLEGQANTVRIPVPGHTEPLSGYSGPNPTVDVEAAVRATSMQVTAGIGQADQPLFADGDYFMINDELKMATSDVAFNGSGDATVSFQPFLRNVAAVGNSVVVQNPTILMHAVDDDIAAWGLQRPVLHNVNLKLVEAIES